MKTTIQKAFFKSFVAFRKPGSRISVLGNARAFSTRATLRYVIDNKEKTPASGATPESEKVVHADLAPETTETLATAETTMAAETTETSETAKTPVAAEEEDLNRIVDWIASPGAYWSTGTMGVSYIPVTLGQQREWDLSCEKHAKKRKEKKEKRQERKAKGEWFWWL